MWELSFNRKYKPLFGMDPASQSEEKGEKSSACVLYRNVLADARYLGKASIFGFGL